MTFKRIIGLFTCVVLGLCLSFPVFSAENLTINSTHYYTDPGGSDILDGNGYYPEDTVAVIRDEPALLTNFVNESYDNYDYNLIELKVFNTDGDVEGDYERWEINEGAVFSFPSPDYTVSVYYNSDKRISATASDGGQIVASGSTIDPHGDVDVPIGTDQAFNIVPDSGYRITDVLVDGASMGVVESHTFSNVTAMGHTIHAVFAADPVPNPAPAPAPNPMTSPAPSNESSSSESYSVLYYMNVKGDEAPFYTQGSYYKYDTAIVTDREPTRNGYRFLYWTDNSVDHGRHYNAMDKLTIHRDYILYAQWEMISDTPRPEAAINDNPGTGAPQTQDK